MSLLGLAFLLLLAGLEVDVDGFRGRVPRVPAWPTSSRSALALAVGLGLRAADLIRSPLLVAIMLSATGLGIVLPILKDAGETATPFGQVVVAGASIAEVAPIVLLSLFFSGESGGVGAKLVLLAGFALFAIAVALALLGLQRSLRLSAALLALQDTTAEIRVRAAFLLLAMFAALASKLGLEAILGAFLAGATLRLVDRDATMTHPLFHRKLEAAGFGIFVPFFFVATGMRLDVDALLGSTSALMRVPVFLVALLVIRALPALLYRPFAHAAANSSPPGCCRRRRSACSSWPARSASISASSARRTTPRSSPRACSRSSLFPLVALTLLRDPARRPGLAAA